MDSASMSLTLSKKISPSRFACATPWSMKHLEMSKVLESYVTVMRSLMSIAHGANSSILMILLELQLPKRMFTQVACRSMQVKRRSDRPLISVLLMQLSMHRSSSTVSLIASSWRRRINPQALGHSAITTRCDMQPNLAFTLL